MSRRRILIRGEKWKVVLRKGLEDEGVKLDGLCDYEKRTIFVDPDCSDFIGTVIHEAVHGACSYLNEGAVREIEDAVVATLREAVDALAKGQDR